MTIIELMEKIAKDNPTREFAISDSGTAIGYWNSEAKRFCTIVGQCITGGFVQVGDLLANGEPLTTYREALKVREMVTMESAVAS